MNRSEEIDQLAAGLVAFQASMPPVLRDAENPFYKSKYADLASVVKAATPLLTNQGLAVTQWPSSDEEGRPTLVTMLLHASGQWLRDTTPLLVTKEDAQGHGSAITYMRRYCYCAVLGIVTDSDDDGNAASARNGGTTQRPAPRPTLRPPPGQRPLRPQPPSLELQPGEEPFPREPPPDDEWDDPDAGREELTERVETIHKTARTPQPRPGGATAKQVTWIKANAKKYDANLGDSATLAVWLGELLGLDEIHPEELSRQQTTFVFDALKRLGDQ